jgi:hypothetical protein
MRKKKKENNGNMLHQAKSREQPLIFKQTAYVISWHLTPKIHPSS